MKVIIRGIKKIDWILEIAPIITLLTILITSRKITLEYFIEIAIKNLGIIVIVIIMLMISIIRFLKGIKDKVFIGFSSIKPVYLDLTGNKHIVVFGMTGSGKTETVKRILRRYGKKKLVIDWSGEYREYSSVKPFELKIDLKKEEIIDAIISTFQLTIPQQTLLIEASRRSGGLKEIIEEIRKIDYQSNSGREVRDALIRRLSILEKLSLFNGERSLTEIESIDLSGIIFEAKKLVANIVLKSFYNKPEPRILVIEEAQNVMPRIQNQDIINTVELIINELRKYGVNVILIAQTPSQISTVYRNAEYIFIHRLRLTHYEAQEMGLKQEDIEEVSKLKVGECILISGNEKRKIKILGLKKEEKVKNVKPNDQNHNIEEVEKNLKIINKRNSDDLRLWKNEDYYREIEKKIMELEANYKQLMTKYMEIEKVRIIEKPIALGEFIDRVEDNIKKISTSISILKDKIANIEEKLSKESHIGASLGGIIGKLEKQTYGNTNKLIELERKIIELSIKLREFEEWVKEVLSKVEDRIQ